MAPRTNPNILRLSRTDKWSSKYTEKKSNEFYLHTSKDLELQKFILKFFKTCGLNIHRCKISYSSNNLAVFVSYKQNFGSVVLINDLNKNQKIRVAKVGIGLEKEIYKTSFSQALKSSKNYHEYNDLLLLYKQEFWWGGTARVLKRKRSKALKHYKEYLAMKKGDKRVVNIKSHNFLNRLFQSLSLFLNKPLKITLVMRPLNNDARTAVTKKLNSRLKRTFIGLKKFDRNSFFKDGVNLVFLSLNTRNSADLLSKFIAKTVNGLKKRHNFFLKFIKNLLLIFINKGFSSKIKGVQIKIKGRLNGVPRAKSRIIKVGSTMPIMSVGSKIDYSESTAYTANGTLGVKVWVNNK